MAAAAANKAVFDAVDSDSPITAEQVDASYNLSQQLSAVQHTLSDDLMGRIFEVSGAALLLVGFVCRQWSCIVACPKLIELARAAKAEQETYSMSQFARRGQMSEFARRGQCHAQALGLSCVGNKESSGRDGEVMCYDCGCYVWYSQYCIHCGGKVEGCRHR